MRPPSLPSTAASEADVKPDRQVLADPVPPWQADQERSLFLVCGLGSIGQNCVAILQGYGATVHAIDALQLDDWEIPELSGAIANLLVGDCRKPAVLEAAGIRQCRAVLFVTNDERVNTEAAFAARLLNPTARLIVRSSKRNLNHFLEKSLGNFIAFEPIELSASAFAFAALGSEIPGFFKLENQLLRVVKYHIQAGDRWCDRWPVHNLNTSSRRVLCHTRGELAIKQFYAWEADDYLQAGDTVVYVEMTDRLVVGAPYQVEGSNRRANRSQGLENGRKGQQRSWQRVLQGCNLVNLKTQIYKFWQSTQYNQAKRVALICGLLILILLTTGTSLLHLEYPQVGFREAFSATFSLLLGGYSDIFGGLNDESSTTWPAQLLGIILTLAGTAFVGVLYALLTEALLTAKFQFFKPRPPVPTRQHVVLIGLNALGQRIAAILQEFKQPLVGIGANDLEHHILPQMPFVAGAIPAAITKVNLAQAKTALVVLDDDLENLEIGLMVHAASSLTELVLRTQDPLFSGNVARLFPYTQVLCAPALSAEVFAAAAFGETVLGLFHLGNQTVLVTEYQIESNDTLNGLLLAEVAYGYGVVAVLHQRNSARSPTFLPSDDSRLEVGDRLVVLATSESLQRIEQRQLAAKEWQVQVEKALTRDAVFEGANEITRVTGCSLSSTRHLMASLPAIVPSLLYKHQAQRLIRHLSKVQVIAHLVPATTSN